MLYLFKKSLEKLIEKIAKVRLNFRIPICVFERLTESDSHVTPHSLKKLSVESSLQADINCTQKESLF